jgi:hypothetical protein
MVLVKPVTSSVVTTRENNFTDALTWLAMLEVVRIASVHGSYTSDVALQLRGHFWFDAVRGDSPL